MKILKKEALLGKLHPAQDRDFVALDVSTTDEDQHFLRKEVAAAWMQMHAAAKNEGIGLRIVSSTRNFERQRQIWENKWFGRTLTNGRNLSEGNLTEEEKARWILRYSAMPGTSRHHWGTDFDINSVEDSYFEETQGQREYAWLSEHAGTFGFFQPYTAKGKSRQQGYEEEKWHWSFGAESERFLEQYNQEIAYADLTGFAGCEVAEAIQVIAVYVNGIARGDV